MHRSPRLSLVFWGVSVFYWLRTISRIVTLLVSQLLWDREECVCKDYGLVLSLSFLGRLVLRIPSRRDLGLGHGSVSGAIPSWSILIYLSEDRGRLEAIYRFFRLVHPNCLVFFCIIPSLCLDRRLTSFSKESNEVGLFWGPVSIKLNKDGLERKWDNHVSRLYK